MTDNQSDIIEEGIDVVVAWVDGSDPRHAQKRCAFLTNNKEDQSEDIAGVTRFSAQGEIEFCILSILKYAPFVRRIIIVTDDQNPNLEQTIERNFPHNKVPIEIVDHKVLFRGYEELLPVFNSLSIETMLYRIPNLSERFVYFNDDIMLLGPTTPEMWFEGSVPICWGKKMPTWIARLLRAVKPKRDGRKIFGFKDAMLNAADVLGVNYFGYFTHAPLSLRRSVIEQFYKLHDDVLRSNASHKFREPSQYNPQTLCYLLYDAQQGSCIYKSHSKNSIFFKPTRERPDYMARKLREADNMPELVFGCISSLDKANQEQVDLFRVWFEERLGVTLSL